MFKFLKSLFASIPEYTPNPAATAEQKWALACNAVLTHINGEQHEWLLGGSPDDAPSPEQARAVLKTAWGIENTGDLLSTLEWIATEGHRLEYERLRELFERKGEYQHDASELLRDDPSAQDMNAEAVVDFRQKADAMVPYWKTHRSILGWDLARAISLCRWGAAVGYLSEGEAWQRILDYASQLKGAFRSWSELGENYRAGYNFWGGDDDELVESAVETLLNAQNPNSPWQLNSWG